MTSTGYTRTGETRQVAVSPSSSAPPAQDHIEPHAPRWWQRPFRSLRARVLLSYVLLLGLSAIVTSLGLAIVQAICEAHGGRAVLVPRPGRGARFELRIPVTVTGRAQAAPADLTSV